MLLYCPGHGCPLCTDCYRHTQPSPERDAFAALPYNEATGTCEWFYSNEPEEAMVREAAYYLWLRNGCPENRDVEHWEEAYRGLCQSMGRGI